MTLASGGGGGSPILPLVVHQPALCPSGQQCSHTGGVCPQIQGGRISSELLMCGGGVHSILLLSCVAKCLETIEVCIWRMFVLMSV